MGKCLFCGIKSEIVMCATCKDSKNIESLCEEIISFKPGKVGNNKLWEEYANSLKRKENFKNIAFILADNLPTPNKEYWKINSITNEHGIIPESSRNWLQEIAPICLESDKLTQNQRNQVKKLVSESNLEKTEQSEIPTPINWSEYPNTIETREDDFSEFVAFSVKTTDMNAKVDSIIEIAGVKVINGEINEREEFVFHEIIKPFQKSISKDIATHTQNPNDMTKSAREMREVFSDFMKFVGDSVLVGFNCINFSSKFLARAGRYSDIKINNSFFDVLRYAMDFKDNMSIVGDYPSLEEIANFVNIESQNDFTTLSDAMTTAKVFLKLKKMHGSIKYITTEEILSDLDEW